MRTSMGCYALVGAGLLGWTLAPHARAADAERQESELTEITVTGTRIKQATGMDTPTPVTSLSNTELQTMAATNVTAALVQLPQFFNSQTAENFGGAANGFFQSPGGGSLNLRGVGTNRTLTLLDGRRMPPATIFGGPDINTFPDALLGRVETVTGGASAAYGTDAVSGVVNFILDTKFNGIRGSAQVGRSERGDGGNQKYSLSFGHGLTDKLHLLVSATHSTQTAINQTGNRDWYQGCGLIGNPALATNAPNSATSPESPRLIPACDLRPTTSSIDGVLNPAGTGPLGRITFDQNGNAVPFLPGNLIAKNGQTQSGGSGEDTADLLNVLLPGQTRNTGFAYLDYDVSDNLNVYAQGLYGKQDLSRALLVGAYGVGGFHPFTIYRDNAFLPASVRQQMVANNIPSVTFQRQISPLDGALGLNSNESKTKVGTLGFKSTLPAGGFLEGWSVDGYIQYGTTNLDAKQEHGTRQDRVFLAIDAVTDPATGQIKCRIQVVSPGLVPDCVPLNLFGHGRASAAALDWITGYDPGVVVNTVPYLASSQSYADHTYSYVGDEAKHRLIELNQRVAELTASGKLFDGWAGPVSAAFGANYRRESVDQRVRASQGNTAADPDFFPAWCNDADLAVPQCVAQLADGNRPRGAIGVRGVPSNVETNIVDTQFSNVPNIRGEYDVKELFTETVVPLVKRLPWMQALTFQGAVRWADYEGSGKIWSWKGGLDAQLTGEIRLRGTYSHDTRAGNISDRFDRSGGAATVTDKKVPGAGELPVRPGQYSIAIVSGGNPAIKPEAGDTFTVGVVYRPEWLAGFDVSVDWLRVQLKDAIETFTTQQIIDQCYERGDQDQCARITRGIYGPTGQDTITFVNQAKQNLGKATFDGVDFELGYARAINLLGGGERISARLFGTRLLEASTTNYFGVKFDNTGSLSAQYFKTKMNLNLGYLRGNFNWNLNGRYVSGGLHNVAWNQPDANGVVNWNVAQNETGSSVYWDTRLSYRLPLGGSDVEIFGNVQNLLDRDPPLVLSEGVGLQTAGGYDQIGRRYVLGFNLAF